MANLRPTFHESWYRVQNLRAKLRPSAQISRQHYRGDRWYVVRDPAGNQYHRLSAAAYRFVGLLDGSRTVAEAWDLAGGIMADDAPTQPEVVQILSQLHAANLLEADITPDSAVLLKRHKQMTKKRLQGRLMNVLFPRIPLWDLDRFLVRWLPVMRVFLSIFGTLLWLAVVIAAIASLAPEWGRLKEGASNAIDPGNWPWLWATFVIIKLIHELGHGFTCRRFGGEVHELGVMFLVFVPAPYVDASSAWSLPSKWQRILVGAGGMVFELFVAAICAFIWLHTDPSSMMNKLAYNTMLIASVSTILFNANPLLRYDGYYILSDWLEIPNLRQKAMEYSLGLIKRHIFRVKSPIPLPPVGQRFWLFFYAVASGIYRVFIGVMIILMVSNKVPVLGILMAIGGVVTWLVVPVFKIGNYLLLEPELHRKRPRAIAFTLTVIAGIVVLVGMIPFSVHVKAQGMSEAMEKQTLRCRTPGFVEQVLVKDEENVHQGQELVRCENPDMAKEIAEKEAQLRSIEAQIQQNMIRDEAQRQIAMLNREALKHTLEIMRRQYDDLTVRAPFDGRLVSPKMNELPGKFLKPGDDIAMVIRADRLRIKAVVDQADAALLFMDVDIWCPIPDAVLHGGWNANVSDVKSCLEKAGAEVFEDPPADRRKLGELPRTLVGKNVKLLFNRPATMRFEFDHDRLASIHAVFNETGGFAALTAEHEKMFGKPEARPTTQPTGATRSAYWTLERDRAAIEIEVLEKPGPATSKSPDIDVNYRLLGRKAEIRLASRRTETLTGRVVTRVPAAVSNLPHASLTYAGGGEHQNDASDQSGTKVATPQFEVIIELDNPGLQNLPGQRAYVRFTMEKDRPLMWQWMRRFWQLLQTQNAQNKWL